MLERDYQHGVIRRIKDILPGCYVLKNDPSYIQGIPDWLILYQDRWAALEIKRSAKAHRQPNQEWYVEEMNDISFAAFICPENEEDVLRDLEHALRQRRKARIS